MTASRIRMGLGLIFSLAICLTVTELYVRKIEYAPDEGSHIAMAEHHGRTLALATGEEWRYSTYRGHAYHLFSPLPYAAHAPFARLQWRLEESSGKAIRRDRVTRRAGLLWTVAQLLALWAVARRLFPDAATALLAATAVSLVPQVRYLHAYVNADGWTLAASTLAYYAVLRSLDDGRISLGLAAGVGLVLAAVLHGKISSFPVGALLAVVFAWRVLRSDAPLRVRLRHLGVATSLPVALAGWFHLHVYRTLANGDWLGTRAHMELMASTFQGRLPEPRPDPATLLRYRYEELPHLWHSFWGWFVKNAELPGSFLGLLGVLVAIGLLGLFALGRRRGGAGDSRRWLRFTSLTAACGLVNYAALAAQWPLGLQGRLLLPALLVGLFPLVRGTAELMTRDGRSGARAPERAAAVLWGAVLLVGNGILLGRLFAAP
jgi:hypothetical protein